jgi:hypothetical protein
VTRCRGLGALVGTLSALASPLAAQLGELQFGVVGSQGTSAAYGPGAGLVLGVATGRLAYVGLRWTYHAGATQQGVTTRVQAFAFDLGVEIPVGKLEVFPGLGLGAARFAQHGSGVSAHKVEFLAAPGVAVEAHVAHVAFIPELQYSVTGNPELPRPVSHHGLVVSLRLVIPIEVARIRR